MIALDAIARRYSMGGETVHALRTIDLSVDAGEYVALMGPSGSGKTTLLNILGLLDRPDAGVFRFEGQDVTRLGDDALAALRQRRIGFIFQSFHLIARLSALDNVALPMTLTGSSRRERLKRATELLERLGLADRAAHRPGELSGGQRQRVAIARAMSLQPSLILADEPTGNLDQRSGEEVMGLLGDINAAGATVLIVTHDADVAACTRRQIRLLDGDIVEDRQSA